LEDEAKASRDKEGLFKTLNAPIKNSYKSKGDGFWNILVKKEKFALCSSLEVTTKIWRLKCTPSPHVSTLKLKCAPSKLAPKFHKQFVIRIQELNNQNV
jgi:hypothetical protein